MLQQETWDMFIIIGRVKKKGAIEFAAGNVSSRFFSSCLAAFSRWLQLERSHTIGPRPHGLISLVSSSAHRPSPPSFLSSVERNHGAGGRCSVGKWMG